MILKKLAFTVFCSLPLLFATACKKDGTKTHSPSECLLQTSEVVGGEENYEFRWAFNCTVEYIKVSVLNGFGQEILNFHTLEDIQAFNVEKLEPVNQQNITYFWLAEFETKEMPGLKQTQRGRFVYLAR